MLINPTNGKRASDIYFEETQSKGKKIGNVKPSVLNSQLDGPKNLTEDFFKERLFNCRIIGLSMKLSVYLIVLIGLQIVFLAFDFIHAYIHRDKNRERLKFRSSLFVFGIILLYGIIQFAGIALIPKIEIIVNWFKYITPDINAFNLEIYSSSILVLISIGIITFYISGLWDYFIHRFVSHSKGLFFTHEYHHLPNRLFLALPGISTRPFVFITVLPTVIGSVASIILLLKIFGLQGFNFMSVIYGVILIQTVILAVTHSEFFMNQWWMYHTFKFFGLTSPQEHEIHHTVDLCGNYSNYAIIWDRVFGTYIDPSKKENQGHQLGLSYDRDFFGVITMGKLKLSSKIRKKYQLHKFCNIKEKQFRKN